MALNYEPEQDKRRDPRGIKDPNLEEDEASMQGSDMEESEEDRRKREGRTNIDEDQPVEQ
ncbi:MAG: hypothetical protein Q8P35_03055 [Candidatus Yanofskybacteria bacterium]|nr:hypothetical protein [Candidatus Yanofskybacteria bacterium]